MRARSLLLLLTTHVLVFVAVACTTPLAPRLGVEFVVASTRIGFVDVAWSARIGESFDLFVTDTAGSTILQTTLSTSSHSFAVSDARTLVVRVTRGEDLVAADVRVKPLVAGTAGLAPSAPSDTWTSGETRFGASIALGDLNCDGFVDLLVGAPTAFYQNSVSTGAAYWFAGTIDGFEGGSQAWPFTLPAPVNANEWAEVGASVLAGDVTGDGCADAILGAPSGSSLNGRILVYRGSTAGLETTRHYEQTGTADALLGFAMTLFDAAPGDGIVDVAIGMPRHDTGTLNNTGSVVLLRGGGGGLMPESATIIGDQGGELTGGAVAALDTDDDGEDELLVGAPRYSSSGSFRGRVRLFVRGAGGAFEPAWEYLGATGEQLGERIATGGDVDADGVEEIAIGTDGGVGRRVVVFSTSNGTLAAAPRWDRRELTVNGFGGDGLAFCDVNGDGFSDLLVGAGRFGLAIETTAAGAVLTYLGGPGGLATEARRIDGIGAYEWFGESLRCAGDLDDDGSDEFLVGAPGRNVQPYLPQSRVDLFRGAPSRGPRLAIAGDGTVTFADPALTSAPHRCFVTDDAATRETGCAPGEIGLDDATGTIRVRVENAFGIWSEAAFVSR